MITIRQTITLGSIVRRVAYDYTNGRTGRVIEMEMDNLKSRARARVHWEHESNGRAMNLRTWVRLSDLRLLPLASLVNITISQAD